MRQARCDGGYCFELTVKAPAITFVRFSGTTGRLLGVRRAANHRDAAEAITARRQDCFTALGPTPRQEFVLVACPLRRLPWGFQVLEWICCGDALSPLVSTQFIRFCITAVRRCLRSDEARGLYCSRTSNVVINKCRPTSKAGRLWSSAFICRPLSRTRNC